MTSPYSHQQLELIQEMKRQQLQQLQRQMVMGGFMNASAMSSPIMLSGPLMMPGQMGHNMSYIQALDVESPPIVVVESEEEEEDDEEQRTLFVANLDERVTEELLYEVFLQAGPIERVRIPKDNTGRQRTFGFVTFKHRCSPPYAMHLLMGLTMFRKTLTIKFNGKTFPPRMNSPIFGMKTSNDKNSDNSSLRASNFSSYIDKTPSSSRQMDRQTRHGSNQMRSHSNSSPYHQQQQQRRDSPNHYNDKRRYHNTSNNKNNANNGNNNRYSDRRSNSGGGKYRR